MVYKVSKGGVRSGNTLRGLQSLRTKRYSRHACLVGRSNLNNKDVTTFLESNTEDKLITETLGSTDVILSLNKKQRWRLPATVSHMIKSGSFNQEKTMVSILERHKLKRRANCVSFACNKGYVRNVTPKQKRYFSFTTENMDVEKSKRQIRRDLATELKRQKALVRKVKKTKRYDVQTVSVFTERKKPQISSNFPSLKEEYRLENFHSSSSLQSNEQEYRLEVFYPCPSSCSLTFNPKYTDVVLEQSNEGKMEVRYNNKNGNKTHGHHRKRFTAKDFDSLNSDLVSEDVEEMWRDEGEILEENDTECKKRGLTNNVDDCFDDNRESFETSSEENNAPKNILANLIAQAEQAKQLCGKRKLQRRKMSNIQDEFPSNDNDEKSHIVYIDRKQPQQPQQPPKPKTEMATNKQEDVPTLSSARVILSTEETLPMTLKSKFGHLYAEAESEPRRFAINVTDDIKNILSSSRCSSYNAQLTSYLVFIHDGFFDDSYDIFRVMFNSNLCNDTKQIVQEIQFEKTSVEDIVNQVAGCLLSLKELKLLDISQKKADDSKKKDMYRFLHDRMHVKVEAFHTSEEFCRIAETETMQEKKDLSTQLNQVIEDFDFDFFCEICYENINPTQFEASYGTRLTKCGHFFCDECWKSHFETQTKDGATQVICPGYQCDSTVGLVTLLSLVHITQVDKLVQRSVEEKLETCPEVKWCPNPKCGRVIRLDTAKKMEELSLNVVCACGTEICFSCLSAPHWPAKCEQAENYMEKIDNIKPINEITEDPTMNKPIHISRKPKKVKTIEVEGRLCPGCRRFIQKNGGCPYMSCKCGLEFCWTCMTPLNKHPEICKPNPSILYEYTRLVKVYHVDVTQPLTEKPQVVNAKPVSTRQKASMYQRALRQRMEFQSNTISRKDLTDLAGRIAHNTTTSKLQILASIGVDMRTIPSDEDSLRIISIKPQLIEFLSSMNDLKRALHHTAEFTFVLLQDAPNSIAKRKAFRLATDLSSQCSFIRSILEAGNGQDPRTVIKRLLEIQTWARRVLDTLLSTVQQLHCSTV